MAVCNCVNFQLDSIVFGVEADAQAADIDDDFNDVAGSAPGTAANFRQEIDFFGTVRARLGFAWDDVLIYATGGYAWANVDVDVTFLSAPVVSPGIKGGSKTDIQSAAAWNSV